MNKKEIEELIKLMNDNKLIELEIEKNGLKVRLKKEGTNIRQFIETTRGGIQPTYVEKQSAETEQEQAAKLTNLVEIKSPMVGTFYRAPSPDSPPFTDVGKIVEPGDVVCVIEAMKLMNEIKSEVKGKVVEVIPENGNAVEYGQILFKVEPVA